MTDPITPPQVQQFAAAWYKALDVHAPLNECLSLLADNGLSMRFPDGDVNDAPSFQKWYERVTNLFFDEKHIVLNVEILGTTDEQAELAVTVRWQASWWEPPAAGSKGVDLESAQKWTVRRCSTTKNAFGLEIVSYMLRSEFKYAPGSARLPASAHDGTEALVAFNGRFADMKQQGGRSAAHQISDHLKSGWPTYEFMAYNIAMIAGSCFVLGLLLVQGVYLSPSQLQAAMGDQAKQHGTKETSASPAAGTKASPGAESDRTTNVPALETQEAPPAERPKPGTNAPETAGGASANGSGQATVAQVDPLSQALMCTLLTLLAAGCAGGTLCNLRGIFKYYRDEGGLPQKFVVPFVIRPWMGAAAGFLVFFVAALFSGAFAGSSTDAATLSWATLGGRLPFVALAMLAGFGSQEFMERMKEVAKTTFSDTSSDTSKGKP